VIGSLKEKQLNEQRLKEIYEQQRRDADYLKLRLVRKRQSDRGNLVLGNTDLKQAFEAKRRSRQPEAHHPYSKTVDSQGLDTSSAS